MGIASFHGTSDPISPQTACFGVHNTISTSEPVSKIGFSQWKWSVSYGSVILGVHWMPHIASGGRSLWAGLGRSGARHGTTTSQGASWGELGMKWIETPSIWILGALGKAGKERDHPIRLIRLAGHGQIPASADACTKSEQNHWMTCAESGSAPRLQTGRHGITWQHTEYHRIPSFFSLRDWCDWCTVQSCEIKARSENRATQIPMVNHHFPYGIFGSWDSYTTLSDLSATPIGALLAGTSGPKNLESKPLNGLDF